MTNNIPFEYCAIRHLELYVKSDKELLESFSISPNINKEKGLLGIGIFRHIDVLYDFKAGVIGVAKKD